MKTRAVRSWIRDISILFVLCTVIVQLPDIFDRKERKAFLTYDSGFPVYMSALSSSGSSTGGRIKSKQKRIIAREFEWVDPQKKERKTVFHIPEEALKKEIRKFGTLFPDTNPLLLKRRGFRVVGKKTYLVDRQIREKLITIIDYRQIFERNLVYFQKLTGELIVSVGLAAETDPLFTFLSFVQYIRYQLPPQRYKRKYLNSFFVPLVCLYEQYGDCDSKSLLLAEFLCSAPGSKERTAMVLIKGKGLAHALLAVKRKPLPGMTSLYDIKRGYYIVLETSSPGWSPGFVSRRVIDTLKAGFFIFVELN
jgi:hypothetical protein